MLAKQVILDKILSPAYNVIFHTCMLENRCKTAQTCRQDISTHGIGYVESVSYCLTWVRISLTCVISLWRNATNCTYNFMFPLKIRQVKNFNQSCLTAAFTFQRVCCPMNNVGVPTVVSTWARNTTYYWVSGKGFYKHTICWSQGWFQVCAQPMRDDVTL